MRRWRAYPVSAKIKTIGYAISVVSVVLPAIASWKLSAVCLFGGAFASIFGMGLRR